MTRKQLYEEVWAHPMIVVAERHQISASYLARVCECLNVPRPPRGYWAKFQAGKRVEKPPLPVSRPSDEAEWSKGTAPGRYSLRRVAPVKGTPANAPPTDKPTKHPLLVAVQEYYDAARLSEEGYLRPLKRNLVDILVSREALAYALNTAHDLFLMLENRGHRIALARGAQYSHRPELSLYEGQKFDYYNREPWVPGRATLVFVGSVAFGLTLYELTEHVEVTYQWDRPVRYVRTSDMPQKRKPAWATDTTYKRHMPCSRLALRAYCPYGGVDWQRQWQESAAGQLSKKFKTIARELEAAVPDIVRLRDRGAEARRG